MKKFNEISSKWVAEAEAFLKNLDADYRSSRAQLDADYQSSRAEAVRWLEDQRTGEKSPVPISLAPSAPKVLSEPAPALHVRKMEPIDAIKEVTPTIETFTFPNLLEMIHLCYGEKDFPKESVRGAFRRWIDTEDCPFVKLPKVVPSDPKELNRYAKRLETPPLFPKGTRPVSSDKGHTINLLEHLG